MRIALVGGGTGGHLFPLVAVAHSLKKKLGPETEFVYFGPRGGIEQKTMQEAGVIVKYVMSGKMRRYFSLMNVVDAFKLPIGIIQAMWLLLFYMPEVIFSKGGYTSVPVILVGWLYRIPIMIHESDARPGVANRFLARFAARIAVSYPSAKQYFDEKKVALTGVPVNVDLNQGSVEVARREFHFSESKPTILVLGGSQGSRIINRSIVKILPRLLFYSQVIHQTGKNEFEDTIHRAAEYGVKAGHEGYVAVPFMSHETLKHAFALADMVISRAGASSIAEIAANGKPSILIPLASAANDHQRMNAYEIAGAGGALVEEEANLGETIFMDKIQKILFDEKIRQKLAEKIKLFYHPEASELIADGIIELAK